MIILVSWLVSTLVIFALANILPGVTVDSFTSALIAALILGIINAVLKPILLLLTLPINLLTLGLFTFVINALLILLAARIVPGFHIDGFISAFIFGIALSIVNFFFDKYTV